MATLSIPWNDGNGNIILTYSGQGDGVVTVSSDTDNLGEDRTQTITLRTVDGTKTVTVDVTQPTGKVALRTSGGRLLRAGGLILRVRPTT